MSIDKKLLEILACPKCKGDVRYSATKSGIICEKCKLIYPVNNGVPVMLIEEAKPLHNET